MVRLFPILLFFSILLSGCSWGRSKSYIIGIDPTFYPAVLGGQADDVYGFTTDLLQAISKIEKIDLRVVDSGTEGLFSSMELGRFDGVLSTLYPITIQLEQFEVSNPYFLTGPVLVVPYDSTLNNLSQFNSKIVGTIANSDGFYIVQKYPHIVIDTFSSPAFLLEALSYQDIDGAVLSLLPAQAFVRNLYRRVLKIASKPLNNEGLRLVVIRGQNQKLLDHFNQGIAECKKRGIYQNLLVKWQLN